MRTSLALLVGSLFAGFLAGCSQATSQGPEPLGKSTSLEPLGSTIIASRLVTLEDAVFDEGPAGAYAVATSRGHHLLISQSTGAFVGGYGPRAYVMRDNRLLNPNGTELPGKIPPGSIGQAAVGTGTHWLAVVSSELSVLDLEGNLVSSSALPFNGRALVWGKDRALVLGASVDASTDAGIQQGQFLDDAGQPLGAVFDIAPGATLLRGGAAFDGSHFVVEYATAEGVFAVAVSSAGALGTPVKIASDNGTSAGLAMSVLSDGQSFVLLYQRSTDDPAGSPTGPHYRIATVDDSLALTVGDQQIAEGLNPNVTRGAYLDGHYLLADYYNLMAVTFDHDGTQQGPAFSWRPFGDETVGFTVSASDDGSSPVVVDTVGHVSRLNGDLNPLDNPPVQFGLGPEMLGISGAAFDGANFRVEWQDAARSSVRSTGVASNGTLLAPGVQALGGANAGASGRYMASNGSSVLRLLAGSSAATLTQSDGSVVSVDLSALAITSNDNQAVVTNGTDYLVGATSDSTRLALVSAGGAVTHTVTLPVAGTPNLAFDGAQWVVAGSGDGAISVTPLAADLTAGTTHSLLTVPGDLGTWLTITTNGAGSFLAWVAHVDDQYQVYGSRLSQDLTLLDAPGVLLGSTFAWNPPVAVSDGTNYWVSWPDAGTSRPAVRRIASAPADGNILLDASPFVPADPPMGWATLAAQPGGPVLLVENAYLNGPVRERVLTVGDPTAASVVGAGL